MAERICPWWVGYLLARPVRGLVNNPYKILSPYVREAIMVFEPGPAIVFFTLELARLVGPMGKVVALDLQPKMLNGLKRRAARTGLLERLDVRLTKGGSLGVVDLAGMVDFALAFAMVHELPFAARIFAKVAATLKPGACLLFAEPSSQVTAARFEEEVRAAPEAGLKPAEQPSIWRSRTVLLKKER
jgi:SAM-dependent methyltransferase